MPDADSSAPLETGCQFSSQSSVQPLSPDFPLGTKLFSSQKVARAEFSASSATRQEDDAAMTASKKSGTSGSFHILKRDFELETLSPFSAALFCS